MTATAPVVWDTERGGYVVARRDLVLEVLRDDATYTVDDPRFSTARPRPGRPRTPR